MSRFVNRSGKRRRLVYRDYARGAFFVTVVTKNRTEALSEIVDGRVRLTAAGRIVEEEWRATAEKRPNVTLDRFVIMPDHFQAIVRLGSTASPTGNGPESTTLVPESLGAIMGRFKSACVRRIRRECLPDFAWQARFHDRVIRNRAELEKKRQYVQDNPKEWANAHGNPPPTSHPHRFGSQGRWR